MNFKKLAAGTAVSTALLLVLASGAGLAFAQSYGTPSTGSTGTTTTPGSPNTGAGGDAASTWLMLGTTALIASGAALYLLARKADIKIGS